MATRRNSRPQVPDLMTALEDSLAEVKARLLPANKESDSVTVTEDIPSSIPQQET